MERDEEKTDRGLFQPGLKKEFSVAPIPTGCGNGFNSPPFGRVDSKQDKLHSIHALYTRWLLGGGMRWGGAISHEGRHSKELCQWPL